MSDIAIMPEWLIQDWCGEFSNVIEMMTGSKPTLDYAPSGQGEFAAFGEGRWTQQPFSIDAEALIWLYLPDEAIRQIGAFVSAATGIERVDENTSRSTWAEIEAQAFTGLASKLTERFGKTVSAGARASGIAPDEQGVSYAVRINLGTDQSWSFGIVLSSAISAPGQDDGAEENGRHRPSDWKAKIAEMDLVFEVELPVTVSFGRTYMPLREVLKLTTGSIIELDRLITEPVDIIINNCVIARGEVVVIEGNYGVRVTDVVDRNDRLALRNPGRPLPAYEEFRLKADA
jgi:flagellar motor switch protein FliN/FliY